MITETLLACFLALGFIFALFHLMARDFTGCAAWLLVGVVSFVGLACGDI